MGPEFLRASLDGDSKRAERLIEAKLPESWPFEPPVLALRLSQLEANPSWEPWLTRVIELESERRIIGVIGFHGPPYGDWQQVHPPGVVEFGYTVYSAWRRMGVAFEAGEALMSWAIHEGVRSFALSINPQNEPSKGLAQRLGFSMVGSQEHEERGIEHIYRMDISLSDRRIQSRSGGRG
jgi:RimJ/RimL family protein N-acetyltransferase